MKSCFNENEYRIVDENKEDKIAILGQMLEAYKNLPPQAQLMNPTNYDLYAALSIVYEIFKS